MEPSFNVGDWYWIVGGSATQVWSSKRIGYVPVSDATYQAWLAAGHLATKIDSVTSLLDVLQQQWAPLILAQGCALTSTGTPALDGTYALDDKSQQNIAAIADGIANGKGLPGGGSTFNYPDATGAEHAFDAAHWTAAAAAFETYIYDFGQALEALVTGGSATMPAAAVTIS